jgi:hypothetical protein
MNQELASLLAGMRNALRDDVLSEVRGAHARGQMAGVIDILQKLERMVVWSPDVLGEELAILERGVGAIGALARDHGRQYAPSRPDAELARPLTHSELESRVATARRRLIELTDWLFDPANGLPGARREAIDAVLRATIRDAMGPQRRLTPRADFAGMAGARD